MIAVITGASSGIGRELAHLLAQRGWQLVLVARRRNRLEDLQESLPTKCMILPLDLSQAENCYTLYEKTKPYQVDLLINGAGFGLFGEFCETDLSREMELIDLNIKAVHILSKLFLQKFHRQRRGTLLNIASSAGYLAGPLMSSYYASKNYVLRLTQAICEEERRKKSGIQISVLCPGPVDTEFNQVAGVQFGVKSLSSQEVAEYTLKELDKGTNVIIPGVGMRSALTLSRLVPDKLRTRITYHIQKAKKK